MYAQEIEKILDTAYDNIEEQIDAWLRKYADENGITVAEAKKKCSELDIEQYGRLAAWYIATHDFSAQANADMRIYNLAMKVSRLEMIKARIGLELTASYADVDSLCSV